MRFSFYVSEWEQITIGQAALPLEYGMNAPAKEFDGVNKYIRITDICEDTNKYLGQPPVSPDGKLEDKYIVSDDDILFARTGASTGKTYLYSKSDGLLYYAGFLIKAHIKPQFDSYFVFSQTHTSKYSKWVKLMSMRSGQPGINSQEYASYSFFAPSYDEQRKISGFLKQIDARIDTQNKIIEKLQSQMIAIYHRLFRGTDDAFIKQLKEICTIRKGTQVNGTELLENGRYYFMNGGITPSGYFNSWNTEAETISISEGGNSCGYVQFNTVRFWSGGHCYTLVDLVDCVIPKFLYHYLKAHEEEIMRMRIGTGLPNIQKKDLETLLIYVPTLEKQKHYLKLLEAIEQKITIEQRLLKILKEQKKFLLSNMFI